MTSNRPSLIHIIGVDYISLVAFLAPTIFWGFYIALVIFQRSVSNSFLYIIIAVSIIGGVALVWRYWLIASVFGYGQEVPAIISNVTFVQDRGIVEYVYTFGGQNYKTGNAIHKTKRTKVLKIGDNVTLYVDQNNPKRAFIRELYL